MSDAQREPDFSILFDGRLVAYVWSISEENEEPGSVRRAGKNEEVLASLPYAEIRTYDRQREAEVLETISQSKSIDALKFKLGVQGFEIVPGNVRPHASIRRF